MLSFCDSVRLSRDVQPLTQIGKDQVTIFCQDVRMTEEHILTLHRTDQARAEFALNEANLEFIVGQLARLPTRRDLAMTALGIIVSTAALVILWAEAFWRL